ncbi:hypothetical protein FQN54_007023 [Arachnomyces sp. PD_36]|nr:hypothetical protein FQN54_007023 [Arachnomyces sp. PD_36]
MFGRSISSQAAILLSAFLCLVDAHTVIVYPGWRGNNLHSNGTVEDTQGIAAAFGPDDNESLLHPYGMQWEYPCGGMPQSTNRTKWPVEGGAISFQPGWFPGHGTAFIYVNLGFGTIPINMSNPMVAPFEIVGPTKETYPGTFCLPHIPLPENATVNVGDNATIQLIETAVHGAALYNCVDITFADPEDVEEVTPDNCFNSSHITARSVFSSESLTGASSSLPAALSGLTLIPLALAATFYVGL